MLAPSFNFELKLKYKIMDRNSFASEGLFPKFIITNGGDLIIGRIDFHKNLVKDTERDTILGGGWWELDRHTHTFTLYGRSEDFGPVTTEQLQKCYPLNYEDYNFRFSTSDDPNEALSNARPIALSLDILS